MFLRTPTRVHSVLAKTGAYPRWMIVRSPPFFKRVLSRVPIMRTGFLSRPSVRVHSDGSHTYSVTRGASIRFPVTGDKTRFCFVNSRPPCSPSRHQEHRAPRCLGTWPVGAVARLRGMLRGNSQHPLFAAAAKSTELLVAPARGPCGTSIFVSRSPSDR